jgi:hypothetical protein
MANRNIYVSADQEATWQKSEEISTQMKISLSQYATQALESLNKVKEEELQNGPFEKIVVDIITRDRRYKKGFMGHWIIEPFEDLRVEDDGCNDAGSAWAVATTQGGKIAVYHFHCNGMWADLKIFDNFDDATAGDIMAGDIVLPKSVAADASERMGGDYVHMLEV